VVPTLTSAPNNTELLGLAKILLGVAHSKIWLWLLAVMVGFEVKGKKSKSVALRINDEDEDDGYDDEQLWQPNACEHCLPFQAAGFSTDVQQEAAYAIGAKVRRGRSCDPRDSNARPG
jgi:hypothetical protein